MTDTPELLWLVYKGSANHFIPLMFTLLVVALVPVIHSLIALSLQFLLLMLRLEGGNVAVMLVTLLVACSNWTMIFH